MTLTCSRSEPRRYASCGSSSVAERQLPKLNVAGSIPVSRSTQADKFLVHSNLPG